MKMKYDIKIVTWVEIEASDQWRAREVAMQKVLNGEFNSDFQGFAVIEEVNKVKHADVQSNHPR